MALPNPNPITTPAQAAQTFPDLWLSNISIAAPRLTQGRITIETLPYNATEGTLGSGSEMVAITTESLWDAVESVPEVANAMAAIFAAVEPLRQWAIEQEALEE